MLRRIVSVALTLAAPVACTSATDSRFTEIDKIQPDASSAVTSDSGPGPIGPAGDGSTPAACVGSNKNYDIPGNGCDDDGDGQTDNVIACDNGLPLTGTAAEFAKALGLCRDASDGGWGVISAEYRGGYASAGKLNDQQHGILPKFGDTIVPREGSSIGVISSGFAREFDTAKGTTCFVRGTTMGNSNSTILPGYPKAVKGCTASKVVNDVIIVRLNLRVPANAKGLSFDFNFFSSEWPAYVCSNYNDGFLAVLKSEAFNGGKPENISFDPNNNPVSVNNDFFDRCTPNVTTGCFGDKQTKSVCAGGESELKGTGFYCRDKYCILSPTNDTSTGGGATGWLQTKAPVKPGEEIQLDFIIWDTGDSALDSSTLIDNFNWEASDTTTVTERPPR